MAKHVQHLGEEEQGSKGRYACLVWRISGHVIKEKMLSRENDQCHVIIQYYNTLYKSFI